MKEMSNSSLLKTALLAGSLLFGTAGATVGEEADARKILVSMTEYVSSLDALSFDFEEYHEIVTGDGERLGLAASGSVALVRPDKIRVLRRTGYTDTDLAFDGQTLSLTDSDAGLFARHALPGTLDHLIDTLRDDFAKPLPAADLLTGGGHGGLTAPTAEIKDLGVGVVSGMHCDHLALRGEEADWQIWIAQGDAPYPCMFIITSRNIPLAPQYRIEVHNWQAGPVEADFAPEKPAAATEVALADYLKGARNLPPNFIVEVEK
ncbi:DUF2092 domain-containing protein [Ruegeria pomeroyi]|uniref:DUF2092 domain-containing protein n=2 Tax=Ruegeria pomeroyi TaxID=89184 RepID=A0A9Q3WKF9_9RHOB|nr:DUF2092 domain-containing protein [Ruegeria pomeroyi]